MSEGLIEALRRAYERRIRVGLRVPEVQEKVLEKMLEVIGEVSAKGGARAVRDLAVAFELLAKEVRMVFGEAATRVEVEVRGGGSLRMAARERKRILRGVVGMGDVMGLIGGAGLATGAGSGLAAGSVGAAGELVSGGSGASEASNSGGEASGVVSDEVEEGGGKWAADAS